MANQATITVSCNMRAYNFLIWAQQRSKVRVSRSALVEMALMRLAEEMGYTGSDTSTPIKEWLRDTADVI